MQRRCRAGGVLILLFYTSSIPTAVLADTSDSRLSLEPIPTSNRSPFVAIHGLPPARGARLVPAGTMQLTLTADAANTSIDEDDSDGRRTVIDGETHRFELDLRRGLAGDWEIGVNLPLLRHSGGFLDQPIEEWHDVFGLPNGSRDRLPRDRLLFIQRNPDGTGFRLDNSGGGIGDLQLSAGRQLASGLALRGTLKLPTGDSDRLTGSGAAVLTGSLHASGRLGDRAHWHASGGLLLSDESNVLENQTEELLAFGSATLAWHLTDAVALKTQLDMHSAAYRQTGRFLDRDSLQLSFAAAFAVSPDWAFELGFSEDIVVETAPDIVFSAGLIRRF